MVNNRARASSAFRTTAVLLVASTLTSAAQSVRSLAEWEKFDFRHRAIAAGQLTGLSPVQLKYLRGILFGRHGRVFQEAAIQDWLKTRSWYRPSGAYSLSDLNDTERANMDAIKEAEYHQHKHIEPGDLKFYKARAFNNDELGPHSRIELLIMRAEIEAIHGKQFPETPWLQSFFDERYWYHPATVYNPASLTDSERANLKTLAMAQKKGRGVALAPGDMGQFEESAITTDLLSGLSLFELRLLRNEVYARHGKRFHTQWIQAHFDAEPWYRPLPDYREPKLADVELRNIDLIVKQEQRLHAELATSPLTRKEIDGLSLEDARKLRNEIYARHGLVFRDRWLDSYFRSLPWYRPRPDYKESSLNDIERRNVQTLLVYERGAQKTANSLAA